MPKWTKRLLWILGGCILFVVSFRVYFYYIKEAPITIGKVETDIQFKKGKTLDIYYPTQEIHKNPPVVVFIHGGAWMAGRKESININRFNGAVNQLRDSGYVVISPEYTLADDGQAPFPYCIEDMYDAMDWLAKKGDSLGFDTSKVGLFGESAGAHIAMFISYAQPSVVGKNRISPEIDYIVNVYGPNKLEGIYKLEALASFQDMVNHLPECLHNGFDLATYLFGFDPKEDSVKTFEFLDKYSPINYLDTGAPPILVIHGDSDIIVPINQSLELKKKLDKLEVPNEYHILPEVNHAFIGASDELRDSVQLWISDFIFRNTPLKPNVTHLE